MNKPDASPLKKTVLYLNGSSLAVQRTDPANSEELKELKQLDNEGLTKILVIDTSASFITNKIVLQKLLDDLSNRDRVHCEIADRTQQGYNTVQIYAANIWLRKFGLTPERYHQLVREEDLILQNYKELKLK